MKTNKSLEDAGVLVKCENETTENKEKEQKIKKKEKKGDFLECSLIIQVLVCQELSQQVKM